MGFVRVEKYNGIVGYVEGTEVRAVFLNGTKYMVDEYTVLVPERIPDIAYRVIRDNEERKSVVATEVRSRSILEQLGKEYRGD